MNEEKILFMVEFANKHVLVHAWNREYAKSYASEWIGGNPDNYIVTPLTEPGDQIHLSVTLAV